MNFEGKKYLEVKVERKVLLVAALFCVVCFSCSSLKRNAGASKTNHSIGSLKKLQTSSSENFDDILEDVIPKKPLGIVSTIPPTSTSVDFKRGNARKISSHVSGLSPPV